MIIISIDYDTIKDLFIIQTDTDKTFHINYDEYEKYNLSLDMEINKELENILELSENFESAKEIALNFMSYRVRSKSEIIQKLKKSKFDNNTIDEVLIYFEENNLINDKEFASLYIQDKLNLNNWSKKKIKYELLKKGLNKSIIDSALDELFDIDIEYDKAYNLLKSKIPLWEKKYDKYKLKQKCYQFLYSKGFEYSIISNIIDEVL